MENPPFWWYLPGKMGIFMGYVSFREGIHDYNWKKGLLPGSLTALFLENVPSQKEIKKGSSSDHHFSKGERLNFKGCTTSNFMGCRGSHKSGVSFQLPRVFLKCSRVILSTTDGLAGSIGILTMKFLSMICGFLWRKIPLPKTHFNFVSVSMDILKKRDPGIYWPSYDILIVSRVLHKTSGPVKNDQCWNTSQSSVRWHNQDTTDAGKWWPFLGFWAKALWMVTLGDCVHTSHIQKSELRRWYP